MTTSTRALFDGRMRPFVHGTALLAITSSLALGGCVLQAIESGEDDLGGSSDGGGSDGSDDGVFADDDGNDDDGDGDDGGTPEKCEDLTIEAMAVLETNCASCHQAPASSSGIDYIIDLPKLLANEKVLAGDATGSPIFKRMLNDTMPPIGVEQRPDDDDLQVVAEWINDCTVSDGDGGECNNQRISSSEMIGDMQQDIDQFSSVDRRFIRYVSLVHLHNIGLCSSELDSYRYGLSKAINSLSLDPIIVQPVPINATQTIFRIDLRDYDWEDTPGFADKWERLVANNPYAFQLTSDDALRLQESAGTRVPFMAADWLVHDATLPPLYYDMLEIPETVSELEQILGISIGTNIVTREVDRAGFVDSGVSNSNRLFERHQLPQSAESAFWLSYDFASNSGQQNLLANPLDFDEDGGEAIYNLPNGLQAYLVTTADGLRLDEAPIAIVKDPLQDDSVVRAGISCISCHDAGLKFKDDELRDFVTTSLDFDAETQELVDDLHPAPEDMDDLITLGNETFTRALDRVWDGAPVASEPVYFVFSKFDNNVDLERAAAEFGVSPESLSPQLGELDPTYAPLNGGTIPRDTFEAKFAESVCLLKLGVSTACGTVGGDGNGE